MNLFSRRKDLAAQNFLLKLVNNNCPGRSALLEGPRTDSRVNLTVVVWIVPIENGQLQTSQAFTAVTKDFSSNGAAVVLDRPRGLDQAVLGFFFEGEMVFLRAQAKHLNPMGGGFFQLGFQMLEIVSIADYPKLASIGLQ
ncbi:MAG: hypothetical protein LLF97_04965 [Planctomycetaceae bacterium]|nr:hypothetical protein [Planctomycetaceae bacterium]